MAGCERHLHVVDMQVAREKEAQRIAIERSDALDLRVPHALKLASRSEKMCTVVSGRHDIFAEMFRILSNYSRCYPYFSEFGGFG